MAIIRTPDGKLVKRPVKESNSTYKVTDSIRNHLAGNNKSRDIAKEYWHHRKKSS